MNAGVRNLLNKKTKCWRKFSRGKNPIDEVKYKNILNELNQKIEDAKLKFESKLMSKARNGKFLYDYIRNKRRKRDPIKIVINEKGERITDPRDIVLSLAVQFSSVKSIKKETIHPDFNPDNCRNLNESDYTQFRELIRKAIIKLEMSKLSGPDGIPACFIRFCNNELIEPLTIIFSRIVKECTFPTDLKQANIIPITKEKK